mmetsp:Transcript_8221/g.34516  ORF Transcript_8221/g.34516 Transcript_8221/m.34516 type:complete len:231 (-) Transcript_8221:196-888(-)
MKVELLVEVAATAERNHRLGLRLGCNGRTPVRLRRRNDATAASAVPPEIVVAIEVDASAPAFVVRPVLAPVVVYLVHKVVAVGVPEWGDVYLVVVHKRLDSSIASIVLRQLVNDVESDYWSHHLTGMMLGVDKNVGLILVICDVVGYLEDSHSVAKQAHTWRIRSHVHHGCNVRECLRSGVHSVPDLAHRLVSGRHKLTKANGAVRAQQSAPKASGLQQLPLELGYDKCK